MAKRNQRVNPFYVLLVIVGVAFVVSAAGYAVMILIQLRTGSLPGPGQSGHHLMALFNEHGLMILVVELALLAIATFGAIATDSYWSRSLPAKTNGPEGSNDNR